MGGRCCWHFDSGFGGSVFLEAIGASNRARINAHHFGNPDKPAWRKSTGGWGAEGILKLERCVAVWGP